MDEGVRVYLFRHGDAVMCAAPRERVIAVYDGGGCGDTDGLAAASGGAVLFRAGIWGSVISVSGEGVTPRAFGATCGRMGHR